MAAFSFDLLATCPTASARAGVFATPHGPIETPSFMPVGTLGSVKSLLPADVRASGAQCVLANAYHLAQRPGADVVEALGGLHRFTGWDGPLLTDSGGFQVFSLDTLREIDDEGVSFRSHLDGRPLRFDPESTIRLEERLGADIVMQLDECVGYPCDETTAERAMRRTQRWAERCQMAQRRQDQALFGIVQGSVYPHLRRESAAGLVALDLPGYAIGGLSIGEPKALMHEMLAVTTPLLPAGKPRYLMGVGTPEDLVHCIGLGVDLFDCVLPTRLGRNGAVFTWRGRMSLGRAEARAADGPIDPWCRCPVCLQHPLGYVAHLHREREPLGARLASLHNIAFLVQVAREARQAILGGCFPHWQAERRAELAAGAAPRP